jgi:hypothetical protein
MDYCPIEKYIPIFLVVLGFVFLIFNANLCLVITAYLKYFNRLKIYDLNKRNSYLIVIFLKRNWKILKYIFYAINGIILLFWFVWIMAGNN